MKQIKVILDTLKPDGVTPIVNILKDGIINVSFNEPITIKAGSKIAVDKVFITAPPVDPLHPVNADLDTIDMSIELSSLELDSFDSASRGRKNVICYFTPQVQKSTVASNTYLFESKVMNFISLNNNTDLDIGTLIFRIVNTRTQTGVNFTYASFNVILN